MLVALMLSLVLALPVRAGAGSIGDYVASLPDEAAECKYIDHLCEVSRRRDDEASWATRAVEANPTADNVDRYRDAFAAAEMAYGDLEDAARVVQKKRPKVPECLKKCAGIARRLRAPRSASH